jgi:hypothetical protein
MHGDQDAVGLPVEAWQLSPVLSVAKTLGYWRTMPNGTEKEWKVVERTLGESIQCLSTFSIRVERHSHIPPALEPPVS